jgi:GDP-L-fucose synthase
MGIWRTTRAIEFLIGIKTDEDLLNIGSGEEIKIIELAEMIKNIVGFEGKLIFDSSMPDGNPRKLIDSSRINSMGWHPQTKLEDGIELSYRWFLKRKQ